MDTEFGAVMFGGPLYIFVEPPPPPPVPYVDSPGYFRIAFIPEGFKRKFGNYPSSVNYARGK